MSTLGDALPAEMARVRDEVLPSYLAIGANGRFAVAMMRAEAEGDVVGMLRAYEALKGYHT